MGDGRRVLKSARLFSVYRLSSIVYDLYSLGTRALMPQVIS
jgi:hypothetical protein